ncbi:MAG: GNAT family N-acetyltransferase [Promethearchaeota archaeon]
MSKFEYKFFNSYLPYLESNKALKEQRIIGNCSIRLDWKNRVGSLGIMIGEKSAWNKGYGTEAMKLLVEYGFRELNMNRIELEVFASNPRAKRCYEKVGFKEEGCKRQAQFINGKYIDEYFMSIIRLEWQKL